MLNSGNAFISLPTESEEYTWRICERFLVSFVISRRRFSSWECDWNYSQVLNLFFTLLRNDSLSFLEATHEKIAYAIQTSGTTGEPKIVHVPYSCIIPNIVDFA